MPELSNGEYVAVVTGAAESVVKQIDPRIARMELAILGDGSIGHKGLVERVRELEVTDGGIDQRRLDGDRRLHERIDQVERKFDRFLWVAAGIGLGSGGVAAGIAQLFN